MMKRQKIVLVILFLCCTHGFTDAFLWGLFEGGKNEMGQDIEDIVEREIQSINHENDFEHDNIDLSHKEKSLLGNEGRPRRWLDDHGAEKYKMDFNLNEDGMDEDLEEDHVPLRNRRFADLLDLEGLDGLDFGDYGIDESDDLGFDFGSLGLDADLLGDFDEDEVLENEDVATEAPKDDDLDDRESDDEAVETTAIKEQVAPSVQLQRSRPANLRRHKEQQCDERSGECDDEEEYVSRMQKKKKNRGKKKHGRKGKKARRGRGKKRKGKKGRKRKGRKNKKHSRVQPKRGRSRSRGGRRNRGKDRRHRGRSGRGRSNSLNRRGKRDLFDDLGLGDLGLDLGDPDEAFDVNEFLGDIDDFNVPIVPTDAPLPPLVPEVEEKEETVVPEKEEETIVPEQEEETNQDVAKEDPLRAIYLRNKKKNGRKSEFVTKPTPSVPINPPNIGGTKSQREIIQGMMNLAKEQNMNRKPHKLKKRIRTPQEIMRKLKWKRLKNRKRNRRPNFKKRNRKPTSRRRYKVRRPSNKENQKQRENMMKVFGIKTRKERSTEEDNEVDPNMSDFSIDEEVDVFGDGEHIEAASRSIRDTYDSDSDDEEDDDKDTEEDADYEDDEEETVEEEGEDDKEHSEEGRGKSHGHRMRNNMGHGKKHGNNQRKAHKERIPQEDHETAAADHNHNEGSGEEHPPQEEHASLISDQKLTNLLPEALAKKTKEPTDDVRQANIEKTENKKNNKDNKEKKKPSENSAKEANKDTKNAEKQKTGNNTQAHSAEENPGKLDEKEKSQSEKDKRKPDTPTTTKP